jgi:D-alanyl-D-alanine carboxypeptidase/D-alanyl-D-alanine-endopeptidase (penicillin-binding protein 4)
MKCNFLFIFIFFNYFLINAQNNFESASIGFIVTDLATEKPIVSKNPNICLTPASVSKIITTATALEILGANFQFETSLQYDGTLSNGVLNGNLYICGGGDPTLGSKYFNDNFLDEWCKALKIKGIKKITGTIIAEPQIFDNEPLPSGWTWADIGNYYGAGVYGLSVFDNMTNVFFESNAEGTKPKITKISPEIDGLIIENHLISKKNIGDSAYFYGAPYENKRQIFGAIEANKTDFEVKADIPNPPIFLAKTFSNYLSINEIEVSGKVSDTIFEPVKKNLLHRHFSPPLSEIIKITNHQSNNMFSEHIFKYLSVKNSMPASVSASIEVVKNFWKSNGLNVSAFFISDGSGLSPHSAVNPEFINNLLIFMYKKSKNSKIFFESLPVAGESGTVRKFLINTKLSGKAHLKSGSIARVQCYAGYIVSGKKSFAITIMINNFSGKRKDAVKEIEKMILEAVDLKIKD